MPRLAAIRLLLSQWGCRVMSDLLITTQQPTPEIWSYIFGARGSNYPHRGYPEEDPKPIGRPYRRVRRASATAFTASSRSLASASRWAI